MDKEDKKIQKHLVDEMTRVSKTNPDVIIYMQVLMKKYEELEQKNIELSQQLLSKKINDKDVEYKKRIVLQQRIDKAIEYIESYNLGKYDYSIPPGGIIELINILKGE